jgi:hypothetical protein
MPLQLSVRQVTWALVGLWAAAVGLTITMAVTSSHHMDLLHFAPAFALTALLLAWPFLLGWRPLTPADKRLRTCHDCGTQWRPSDEGTGRCPACRGMAA